MAVVYRSNMQTLEHLAAIGATMATITARYNALAQIMTTASYELWNLLEQIVREGLLTSAHGATQVRSCIEPVCGPETLC